MTLILLLVINGDFCLQTGSGCGTIWTGTAFLFPFLLLYRLGLPSAFRSEYYTGLRLLSAFRSEYYTGLGLLSCFLFQVLYEFGTAFLIEYYTGFGLILSQVRSVPQLYLRSFKVEGKP